jgi:hypothetical protein
MALIQYVLKPYTDTIIVFNLKLSILVATGSWDNTVKLWDCSKINDYLRRRALTHGSIAAKAIKGLTTGNQLQLDSVSQIRFSNHAQGRIGNPPKIEYYTPQNEQDRMK